MNWRTFVFGVSFGVFCSAAVTAILQQEYSAAAVVVVAMLMFIPAAMQGVLE